MLINYVTQADHNLASYRYRIINVCAALSGDERYMTEVSRKPKPNASMYVVSKHFAYDAGYDALETGKPVIMDVCDNHFEHKEHGPYYRRMCQGAHLVTCNSKAMKLEIIKYAPNARIRVIQEAYEMPELNPSYFIHKPPKLMWFGHPTNLDTLYDIEIPGDINIVTQVKTDEHMEMKEYGRVRYYRYSPIMLLGVAGLSDAVVIPTDADAPSKRTKSANRFVEALRLGKFVIAHAHPAHMELSRFGFIGDIVEGCRWLVENADEARMRVQQGQLYIRERFSPVAIADRWRQAFDEVANATSG